MNQKLLQPSRKEQKLKSQDIDLHLSRQATYQRRIIILGGCSSGKSTLRHGIYHLSNHDNFSQENRKRLIRKYIIRCLKVIILEIGVGEEEFANLRNEMKGALNSSGNFSSKLINFMKYLLSDKNNELVYISHHFRYLENIRYFISESFMSKLQSNSADFTITDLLHVKIPHSKTSFYEFSYGISKFIDPSPQFNERRKWISQFDNMTRVIYLISLADYHLIDSISGVNCLRLALQNFSEFVNYSSYYHDDVSIILTKFDLFKEKLEMYPFSDYFPEYTGPNHHESVIEFLKLSIPDLGSFRVGNLLTMTNLENINYLVQENEISQLVVV